MIVVSVIVMLVIAALVMELKEEANRAANLEDQLPIYKVEGGLLLSKQGDVTVAFRLRLPEVFTLSGEDLEALHHIWIKAIKILPVNTVLHKQDWFTQDQFQADASTKDKSFLGAASDRFFHGRSYLAHDCFLMITQKANGRKLASSVLSNLFRKSIVPTGKINEQLLLSFQDKIGQFEKLLSEAGYIQLTRLGDDELAGTEQTAGLLERYLFLLKDGQAPVLKDIAFKPAWQVGEHFCELYTMSDVEDLPSLCGPRINYDKYSTDRTKFSVSFASPVGSLLGCNHIYNQFLVIEDTQKVLKTMEAKRRRLQSLSAYSRENTISRDSVNAFLNEAISQQRLPVRAHFNVMVWSSSQDELKELRNKASSAIAQMDANPRQELKGAPQIFWAALPGNAAELPFNDTFTSFAEQASCFLANEGPYRSAQQGIRFGERINGRPVNVDLFDEPMATGLTTNRNMFVCGGSGSGKSMAMNTIVRSLYDQGAHSVIVDIGGSYKGLCSLLGGYYFTYKEDDPISFNPFYISPGDVLDTEKKESLKALLLSLWKQDGEAFSRSEYVALSNAVQGYYEWLRTDADIFPCFDSFYEYLEGKYVQALQLAKVKEKDFDINNMLYVLRPFYRQGEFDYLLNARKNLDLMDQRLIIFELDNVKDHKILFPVITLIIMELFISKMRKLPGKRKLLVIEEAWKAIAKSGMADFIKYVYKTVRKFNGIACVVTQEVDDLISSPIIKEAIISNADIKVLMDMRKFQNKFDALQATLGLSEKAKMILLSVNKANEPGRKYREVFIDPLMKVYRNELSMEEYYCYTTEEKEKVMVMQYAEKYGSMEAGIKALVRDLKKN